MAFDNLRLFFTHYFPVPQFSSDAVSQLEKFGKSRKNLKLAFKTHWMGKLIDHGLDWQFYEILMSSSGCAAVYRWQNPSNRNHAGLREAIGKTPGKSVGALGNGLWKLYREVWGIGAPTNWCDEPIECTIIKSESDNPDNRQAGRASCTDHGRISACDYKIFWWQSQRVLHLVRFDEGQSRDADFVDGRLLGVQNLRVCNHTCAHY